MTINTYTPKTQRILGRALALVLLLVLTLRLDGQPGTQAEAKAGGLSVQAEHVSQATIGTAASAPLGTGFSYQGRLDDGGSPANGMYDFQFRLYDSPTGTNQVGSPFIQEGVEVIDGLFSVQLDFGPVFDGTALYLEIAVKPTAGGGGYDILDPRQPLSPVPYALHAASIADGAVTGSKIGEPCGEGQVLARMGGAWSCADAELDLAPQQQISHTVQIGPFTYSSEEIQADLLTLGGSHRGDDKHEGSGRFSSHLPSTVLSTRLLARRLLLRWNRALWGYYHRHRPKWKQWHPALGSYGLLALLAQHSAEPGWSGSVPRFLDGLWSR